MLWELFSRGFSCCRKKSGQAINVGSFLIAEVMASKGFNVRPLPRVSSHDTVQVVFARGTFIDGSISELSCDGPLRKPYSVFRQGGRGVLKRTQWAVVLGEVLKTISIAAS
ncbi:uncharacterized protein [Aristolochia californica]|uniref:uncharacterized protein n=1 Tax=Aristolochia californica TaxID=171875 RepID=UPI0035E0068D